MPRIFDAFMVFDEVAILDIRFAELAACVDTFVICEAPVTFSGKPKPLYFPDLAKQRWPHLAGRIHYHVAGELADVYAKASHPLEREGAQRDALLTALRYAGAQPDDLCLISDADEIPRASVVRQLARHAHPLPARLGLALHYFSLDLLNRSIPQWYGPRATTFAALGAEPPEVLRHNNHCTAIENAGWSWSFLGDVADAQRKLAAWSHHEWNKPPFNTTENLAAAIAEGRDWDTERAMSFERVELTPGQYPDCLFNPDGSVRAEWLPFVGGAQQHVEVSA